jgi:hypothetical protein
MRLSAVKKSIVLLASLVLILLAAGRARTTTTTTPLPNPVLIYTGAEFYEAGGKEWTRYRYMVTNLTDYPNEMFAAAPIRYAVLTCETGIIRLSMNEKAFCSIRTALERFLG